MAVTVTHNASIPLRGDDNWRVVAFLPLHVHTVHRLWKTNAWLHFELSKELDRNTNQMQDIQDSTQRVCSCVLPFRGNTAPATRNNRVLYVLQVLTIHAQTTRSCNQRNATSTS
eukprot:5261797-Amphidinium_carterae.1